MRIGLSVMRLRQGTQSNMRERWFICQKFGGLPLGRQMANIQGRRQWGPTLHYSRAIEFRSKAEATARLNELMRSEPQEFTLARWAVLTLNESLRRRGMNLKRFGADPRRYSLGQFV